MWKTRLLIVVLAVASAWGWGRASLTEPAVRRAQQREARWSLSRATAALPALLRIAGDDLRMRVTAAVDDPAFRAARETPESAQLFVRRLPKEGTDEDWILLSKDGVVVARSANAAKRGASLRDESAVRSLISGRPWSGLYLFEGSWRLLSGAPVRGALGLEGALMVLRRLDGELAHELAEGAGAEVAFADGERVVGTAPSAALADLRQRPWEGGATGAIDEIRAGGVGWHIVIVGHDGPEELEILLLRQHVLGDDPLAELDLRASREWLRPAPVAVGLLFVFLALFGLWIAGKEGRSRKVYTVHSTPLPAPLPESAFLPPADDLPPPVLEESMLDAEWSSQLESAVDSVLSEPASDPAPPAIEAAPVEAPVERLIKAPAPAPAEARSVTVEWRGRYDTPTPLTEALKTPVPEPMADDPQRKYEQLYVRFLQSRQACGESTDEISYERFERRLDRNAAKVRDKYDCDDVRFNIRVVDGRAKIKAIPVDSRASA